jgi:hypothetical protein
LARAGLGAHESVEAMARLAVSIKLVVVPAIVHVLVHCEQGRPRAIVVGALEYGLVGIQALVLDVLHEPLDSL